ncbi:MAG TPA: hypothetical protein PLJ47_01750 [Candidatus Hydrogenedentes bacterium]|nr:hypothetical protein [Candidatus Hydrogenedentota bacterium]
MAYSKDGKHIVCGGVDGAVYVWALDNSAPVKRLIGHKSSISKAVFTNDGRFILSLANDGSIIRWNAETGAIEASIPGGAEQSSGISVCEVDEQILVWGATETFCIRDSQNLEVEFTARGRKPAFVPDGQRMAFVRENSVVLCTRTNGSELAVLDHGSAISSLRTCQTGTRLASSGSDGTIILWEIPAGTRTFQANHGEGVFGLVFSFDNNFLISMSSAGSIRLWKIPSGDLIAVYEGHSRLMNGLVANPTGPTFLTTGQDYFVKVWKVGSAPGRRLVMNPQKVDARCEFSANADVAAITFRNGLGLVADLKENRAKLALSTRGHVSRKPASFSPDGKMLCLALDGFTPIALDVESRDLISMFIGHTGLVNDIHVSPDAAHAASCGEDQKVRIWEIATGNEIITLDGHTAEINSVRYSADGHYLLTASDDKTVRLWDVATRKELRQFVGHTEEVLDANFDAPSSRVISASLDGTTRIWDISTGNIVQSLSGHQRSGSKAAFDGTGARAFTVGRDSALHVWDVATGEEVIACSGQGSRMVDFALSKNSRDVLSILIDGSVILWEGWSPNHSPTDSAKTSLREYVDTHRAEQFTAPLAPPPVHKVLVAQDTFQRGLHVLIDALQTAESESLQEQPRGYPMSPATLSDSNALMRIGIESNARLSRIEGLNSLSLADFIAALKSHQTNYTLPIVLHILKDVEQRAEICPISPVEVEREVKIDRAGLLSVLATSRELLQRDAPTYAKTQAEMTVQLGEATGESSDSHGIWVASLIGTNELPPFAKLGLANGDRIISINGQEIRSVDGLINALAGIEAEVKAGSNESISFVVRRGEFQWVTGIVEIDG